jgi:hypothetical protein
LMVSKHKQPDQSCQGWHQTSTMLLLQTAKELLNNQEVWD